MAEHLSHEVDFLDTEEFLELLRAKNRGENVWIPLPERDGIEVTNFYTGSWHCGTIIRSESGYVPIAVDDGRDTVLSPTLIDDFDKACEIVETHVLLLARPE